MKTRHEELTRSEQRYLEHVKRAAGEGVTLAQYCRAAGLSAPSLYNAKRELIRKGALSTPSAVKQELIEVRVAPAANSVAGAVCRLRHPCGWVIECTSWPPTAWLMQMVSGGDYAAS